LESVSPRFLFLLFASVFLGLVIALGIAGSRVYFGLPILETGDVGINALQVDNAKHFSEIYGNYSRFEFSHPGPAFFYVYAAGERLFTDLLHLTPAPGNAHLLTCMMLQSFFFALGLTLLATHLPWRVLVPAALLIAALHFGALREPFVSLWPPHVLLMPFFCFLVACVSVASGRVEHLPFLVLAGCFLFHGHVAQPLFVGSLTVLSAAIYLRGIYREKKSIPWKELARLHRNVLTLCGGMIAIFLVPLVIDAVTLGTRSNVATIIGRFYANREDSKTPFQSFLYFLSFATSYREQDTIFSKLGPETFQFFREHAVRIGVWILVFLLPPALLVWRRKGRAAPEKIFWSNAYLFLFATVGLCVLWGMAQAGPMAHFNGYFYYGIYYFALVLAVLALIDRMPMVDTAPVGILACAGSAVLFASSFKLAPLSAQDAGVTLADAVEATLKTDPGTAPKLLVFEHRDWPMTAGLALYLQRHDIPFYTAPFWEFMFGQRHDLTRLGPRPESKTSVWWITKPGPGGISLTPEVSVFTTPAPLQPNGGEIRLQGGDNGFRYLVYGLTVGNIEYAWTNLPETLFRFAPEHADNDVRIAFEVESAQRNKGAILDQPAEIYFNGKLLGMLTAHDRGVLSVVVPAALWNAESRADLELRFPTTKAHHTTRRPRYNYWFSWAMWKIRFEYERK
jgi:hypothetical protein